MGENDIADFTLEDNTVFKHEQGLAEQNFDALDLDHVTAETFEVMSRQATINVGTIGHVAHGKSTVVKAVSGVKTQKFIREALMNITIHLGYANAKVYKCDTCEGSAAYHAFSSSHPDQTTCPACSAPLTLKRHLSFLDCPGHDVLMATMLNGAAIMDAALLLIAANEVYPQPQTLEHLTAAEMMQVQHLIVLQNKIDLVPRARAEIQYGTIRRHLDTSTSFRGAPILPISAQLMRNVDVLLEYLCHIPLPVRQLKCPARMMVLRSFDVSHPGDKLDGLTGGVVGGTLERGCLVVGQEVELRPGLIAVDATGLSREDILRSRARVYVSAPPPRHERRVVPLRTSVVSLRSERNPLRYAVPGGLVAIGTSLDPSLTRQNKLRGQLLCTRGDAGRVYGEVEIQFFLLKDVVGLARPAGPDVAGPAPRRGHHPHRTPPLPPPSPPPRVQKLRDGEVIVLNIGTLSTAAEVLRTAHGRAKLRLETPVCCDVNAKLALSRLIDRKVRLIGWGLVKRGIPIDA